MTNSKELTTTQVTETGLATTQEFSTELAPTAAAAEKQFEIQSAILIAKRFPRNEDQAFQNLMRACGRTSFAEDAEYAFPRGGQTVKGPSVNLAREAARVWGNIRYGLSIIREDADSRQIQGWAWDVESNTKITAEDDFRKLIYRKGKNGDQGKWITPDERDLRELTNRRGAILVRNCILQLLPKDLIEDALEAANKTLKAKVALDPDGERKKILAAFGGINVTAEMLGAYLGHPVAQSSPAEIANLRSIYKSISDGNSTWAEYVTPEVQATELKEKTRAKVKEMKEKLAPTPAETTPTVPSADDIRFRELCTELKTLGVDDQAIEQRIQLFTQHVEGGKLTPDLLAKLNLSFGHWIDELQAKKGAKK